MMPFEDYLSNDHEFASYFTSSRYEKSSLNLEEDTIITIEDEQYTIKDLKEILKYKDVIIKLAKREYPEEFL
jgi:hypothetical protein